MARSHACNQIFENNFSDEREKKQKKFKQADLGPWNSGLSWRKDTENFWVYVKHDCHRYEERPEGAVDYLVEPKTTRTMILINVNWQKWFKEHLHNPYRHCIHSQSCLPFVVPGRAWKFMKTEKKNNKLLIHNDSWL